MFKIKVNFLFYFNKRQNMFYRITYKPKIIYKINLEISLIKISFEKVKIYVTPLNMYIDHR